MSISKLMVGIRSKKQLIKIPINDDYIVMTTGAQLVPNEAGARAKVAQQSEIEEDKLSRVTLLGVKAVELVESSCIVRSRAEHSRIRDYPSLLYFSFFFKMAFLAGDEK